MFWKNHKHMICKLLKMFCIVILGCCVWAGVASDLYIWYFKSEKTQFLRELYSFLDGRVLITLPICFVVIYATVFEIRRRLIDEDIRPWRAGGVVLLSVILNVKCSAQYPCILGGIQFKDLLNVLLLCYSIACCYGIVQSVFDRFLKNFIVDKRDSNNEGFVVDDEHEDKLPDNVKKYGEALIDQLIATIRKRNDSFAVGITGEWGSGKTTFLNFMKKNLKDKAEIVNFNTWMCQTPDQVTRDFFSSLRINCLGSNCPIGSNYNNNLEEYKTKCFQKTDVFTSSDKV